MIPALRASLAILALGLLAGLAPPLKAETAGEPPARPLVGLIIDDLGDRYGDGRRAIALPGAVTYAILPQTTYSRRLAEQAHGAGKEVMLHQPMQAMNGKAMGPGGLSMEMGRRQLRAILAANLASVPHARGVNNHMGSLLTRHPGHMAWLMEALREHGGLYFIDSTTTSHSVARRIAMEYQLPNGRRNVFLDHVREPRAILRQFIHFIEQARSVGSSVAIGHPYAETLAVLEQVLPHLEDFGVELLSVSELIARTEKRREQLWQASLSPLPRGAKN
jgi:polysaccharide deacetylase 2 family uncharacterized protein YibQ